jgi:hypothetical protein
MAATSRNRTRTLTATVSKGVQAFEFRLNSRPLALGSTVVQYYWMDSSLLRQFKSEASFAAFRTVVGHWAATMNADGVFGEIDQQVHFVLASCYPLVATAKGMQDVYKDAYLGLGRTKPTTESLPKETGKAINRVVRSRDVACVRAELDCALGRFEPPPKVMPLLQEAVRRWVGNGVVAMRSAGADGLEVFHRLVDAWMMRYRKKGGGYWVRQFLNLFSYQCKAAFYTCYTNAWIEIIPWLRDNDGLDPFSERFLRFWHNQQQSAGGADGRDPFNGQVLALHPLSGFFMKDPGLCAVAGRFFSGRAYDRVFKDGLAAKSKTYWSLVGAILTAAHQYRQALDRQNNQRVPGTKRTLSLEKSPEPDVGPESHDLMRDFISSRQFNCSHCRSRLVFSSVNTSATNDETFTVLLTCPACCRNASRRIPAADLYSWLQPDA